MVLQKEKVVENKRMEEVINRIYNILTKAENQQNILKTQWEHDLREEIITYSCTNIWDKRILKSMSIRIKGHSYKLIWGWYLTPVKLYQIDTDSSKLCWRGYEENMLICIRIILKLQHLVFRKINEIIKPNIEVYPKYSPFINIWQGAIELDNEIINFKLMNSSKINGHEELESKMENFN